MQNPAAHPLWSRRVDEAHRSVSLFEQKLASAQVRRHRGLAGRGVRGSAGHWAFVARNVGNAVYWNQLYRTDAVVRDPFPAEPTPAGASIVLDFADPYARHVCAMWNGAVAGVIAMLGIAAITLGVWWLARRWLDRRRAAAWQDAWGLIERQWSGRR
jgi:hypothetical protein